MDFLASLNVDDLPEQQTRMMEIMERHPNLDVRLGFDACCTCATRLLATKVTCSLCRRVAYCSESCRQQDAQALAATVQSTMGDSLSEEAEQVDNAGGHSSIVCALLRLCQDDEDVESQNAAHLEYERREAALDRIRSELESYPATLANVLTEGPCYQSMLQDCKAKRKLVVHVIGASVDGELWGNDNDLDQVSEAYAEALCDLAESTGLECIEILMFGPDCPKTVLCLEKLRPLVRGRKNGEHTAGGAGAGHATLVLRTYHGLYNAELLQDNHVPNADVVVFFNPGFTVPDYQWIETLACIPLDTPFLSTTNTEMEGIADCQFLLDQDKIQTIPPGLAEMLGLYSSPDDDDDGRAMRQETSFFAVNPFCGMRVRQSGTMANDLFVKNRWILGGIINSFDPSASTQNNTTSKKRRTTVEAGTQGNTKAKNPALI